MAKVQLPPDSYPLVGENIITTIIDTNNADLMLATAIEDVNEGSLEPQSQTNQLSLESSGSTLPLLGPMIQSQSLQNTISLDDAPIGFRVNDIDSIVLVYDLERMETFSRIEDHWLPLIEKCYHGEVR